jgi:alpha-mannosidase
MIGNAHLDPAWMWQMSEGLEAFIATCRSALDRMDEYPDFIFTCSSGAHLEFLEQCDAELFKRIQQRASEGRWVNVGGWWVEADCNIPSGESFIRQALLGQQFFQLRFGKTCDVGYCIDSFGHNANLPQLLKICGMPNYVFMRPDETEKELPTSLFKWVAPSGDSINTYRIALHYSNFARTVEKKLADLIEHPLFTVEHDWMIFYGVGNHGGGPTKAQIEQILQVQKNSRNIVFSSPSKFFQTVPKNLIELSGDMHPHAIGCYSAHSELKQLNRRAENALLFAEKMCVIAELHTGFKANWDALRQGWKNVCFNQFHDIIGGVAIKEACDDAISMYRESISIADREKRLAVQSLATKIDTRGDGEAIIMFNPKSFESEEQFAIELWHPHASELGEVLEDLRVIDERGKECIVQKSRPSGKIGSDRTRFVAKAKIPAFGWKTLFVHRHKRSNAGELKTFEKKGAIGGLIIPFTKSARWADSGFHNYHPAEVYHDASDTWGHHKTGFTELAGSFSLISADEVERGPLYKTQRIISKYERSTLIEEYKIGWHGDVMDVKVTLDWREQHAVAKLRFDHLCDDPVVTYEVPYAAIERPISEDEQVGQSWVHVRGTRNGKPFGMALINDSKYSCSVTDKSIYLTIARSPLYAHHVPPHEIEPGERLEFLDQGIQSFDLRLLFNCPDWTKARLNEHSAQLHQPVIAHYESAHEGELPQTYRGISLPDPRIEVNAMKRAENGEGYIIRAVNRSVYSLVSILDIPLLGASAELNFRPFEIKTLSIVGVNITEISAIEL